MDELVNSVSEPAQFWGGSWTEKKLDAFARYVSAYLVIMRKHPYWKTIYFDGFAGAGNRSKKCNSLLFNQLQLTPEEDHVYKGAAERVLTLPNGLSFDYYYFIDLNQESLEKLKIKLTPLQKKYNNDFQYRTGDCNDEVLRLSNALKDKTRKFAALIFLDPFGMQIDWDAIASLKGTRSDVWVLIPTGVIVNRLLDRNCKLKNSVKLQSFFGLPEEEIRNYFYKSSSFQTLFGEEEIITKISNPIQKIAGLYIERLRTIWDHVAEKPLVLKNSRGVPIFHFVFASNNPTAVKIAGQIIEKT